MPTNKKNFKKRPIKGGKHISKCKETNENVRGRTDFGNDFDWYNRIPGAIKPTAMNAFGYPLGLAKSTYLGPTSQADSQFVDAYKEYITEAYPGIMALSYVPTIGRAEISTDPVNMASQQLYTFVRYHNSGSRNYERSDLTMMMLAADSMYQLYFMGVRALAAMTTYQATNRYMAETLVKACGFNFLDILTNYNNFKSYINILGARLNQISIPKSFSICERHAWLCTNIFKDSDVEKAQLYLFKPSHLYRYDGYASETGTQLTATEVPGGVSGMTYLNYRTYAEQLLENLLNDEDVGIMSGDILKAFGAEALVRFGPIDETLTAAIVYDKSVLRQIHNATVWSTFNPQDIIQEDNIIKCSYPFGNGALSQAGSTPLDMDVDVPTIEEIIEATRLTCIVGNQREDNVNRYDLTMGTELVRTAKIYTGESSVLTIQEWNDIAFAMSTQTETALISTIKRVPLAMSKLSYFHNHPRAIYALAFTYQGEDQVEVERVVYECWDTTNCVFLAYQDLDAINNAAVMSQFYLTEMDKTLKALG